MLKDFFAAVYLVNLRRRPDRLAAVRQMLRNHDWPFLSPEIVPAVDGSLVPTPPGWQAGGGAYACKQSHVGILERAIQNKIEPILVLEDDIVLESTFREDVERFLAAAPADWQCLMLGGQHMKPPRKVVPGVVRALNCQRTHAYAVRGRFMRDVYAQWASPHQTQHIDWKSGPMMAHYPCYAPERFLFGQARSQSEINGRINPTKFWNAPSGNEPVLVLNCSADLVRELRESYGVHTGYSRDKTDIDLGLRKVFAEEDKLGGMRRWIEELQWECASEEGFVLGVWHPKATVDLVRECWRGPVVEVKQLEDAIPYLACKQPKLPLFRTHVILLHTDRASAAMLSNIFHYGNWKDEVTGYDNGIREWLAGNRSVSGLANIINTLAEEAEKIPSAVPCIWHPDVSLADVQAAADSWHSPAPYGKRQVVFLEGTDYQTILQQWQTYLAERR